MLRVMLVDDEAIVRKDLRQMIDWESHGYHIEAEAADGFSAFELCAKERIDLVIADIVMPKTNGLEMAARIRETCKDVRFIFLTSYSDFEYAREAMRLGADTYLLKHELDAKMLLAELNRMFNIITESDKFLRYSKGKHARMLFSSELSPEQCEAVIKQEGIPLRKDSSFLLLVHLSEKQDGAASIEQILDCLQQTEESEFVDESLAFSMEEQVAGVIIAIKSVVSLAKCSAEILTLANTIQDRLYALTGKKLFLVIGPVFHSFQELPMFYQRTQAAFEQEYFYSNGCVILAEQIRSRDRESLRTDMNELCAALSDRQYSTAQERLKELFLHKLVRQRSKELVHEHIPMLADMVVNAWNTVCCETMALRVVDVYSSLLNCANIYIAFDILDRMLAKILFMRDSRYPKRIMQVIDFIEQYYQQDITLESIANLIGVSEAYMSQLFKQHIGISFKSYLTRLRIEKAKELLSTGKYRVHEVGEMAGYSTTQYFCMVFKQVTGMSPLKYEEVLHHDS